MNKWRFLPLAFAGQPQHIASAEQLLASASNGSAATLYWSIAQPEALVLGFSQKRDILNPQVVAARNIPIYHRRAGGTAVLVGPQLLGLDIILPAAHPLVLPDIVESYRWLGEAWVATLRSFGITARLVSIAQARQQRLLSQQDAVRAQENLLRGACYASLSPYEVVVDSRKIVGLDMIRRRHATLLQAGLLLQWQPDTLALFLGHNAQQQQFLLQALPPRAIGLNDLTPHAISPQQIIAAFQHIIQTHDPSDPHAPS